MTSPVSATARATARSRPAEAPAHRPLLEVVRDDPRHRPGRRRGAAAILSAGLVVGSLLLVVAGHAVLAEGQVRLSAEQSAVAAAQQEYGQEVLSLATLESPSRIVGEAKQDLHMVAAGQIVQLPHVPLGTPLPTPTVSSAPVAPAGQ